MGKKPPEEPKKTPPAKKPPHECKPDKTEIIDEAVMVTCKCGMKMQW